VGKKDTSSKRIARGPSPYKHTTAPFCKSAYSESVEI